MAVVVEKVKGGEALFPEKGAHFGHRGPPVIVVALHQQLLAGELLQKAEVRLRLRKVDAPGGVPRQHQGILHRQGGEALPNAVHVILPRGAEHLHGFVSGQGEVQVPDGVESHSLSTFLTSKSPAPPAPCPAFRWSGRSGGPCPSVPPGAGARERRTPRAAGPAAPRRPPPGSGRWR